MIMCLSARCTQAVSVELPLMTSHIMVIITESIVQCMLKSLMDDQTVENAVNNENVKDGDCNGVEQENDVVKTSTVETTGNENEDVKSVDITQNNREDFARQTSQIAMKIMPRRMFVNQMKMLSRRVKILMMLKNLRT